MYSPFDRKTWALMVDSCHRKDHETRSEGCTDIVTRFFEGLILGYNGKGQEREAVCSE